MARKVRPIYQIAEEIEQRFATTWWGAKYPGIARKTRPYLRAMRVLEKAEDTYAEMTAVDVLTGFLEAFKQVMGDDARRLRREIRTHMHTVHDSRKVPGYWDEEYYRPGPDHQKWHQLRLQRRQEENKDQHE